MRLRAVRRDPERRAGGHHRLPERQPVPRRHVELVGQLPGERDPEHAPGDPRDDRVAPGHEREGLDRRRRGPGASAATTSRDRGPTTATVAHCSVTLVARTRSSGHSVWSHSSRWSRTGGGVAGRRRHVEPVVGEPAVTPSSKTIPSSRHITPYRHEPDLERRERVRVDAVEEDPGVRPLEVDLAEGRRVHHGHPGPRGRALAQDGRRPSISPSTREVARPLPLADVLEDGAVRRRASRGSA